MPNSKNSFRNQFIFNQNTKTTLLDGYATTSDSVGTIGSSNFAGGTFSRVSAGTYDLLLDQAYPAFLSFNATVHSPNVRTGLEAEIVWHNTSGTVAPLGWAAQTVRFVFLSGTTPTDLPANAGFDVTLLVKDSVAPAGS